MLETAILGYGQWQLDPDSGADQPALLARVLDQVYAAGVQRASRSMGCCAVRRDGTFVGENTDGKGFLRSLKGIIDPRDKRGVIFGAGGAAHAIAVELRFAGMQQVTVVNRSEDPAPRWSRCCTTSLAATPTWRYGQATSRCPPTRTARSISVDPASARATPR